MAILITNDGDKVVNTIADRDAITQRFDGMNVTVRDSIADVLTGGGEAGYQWNDKFSRWMLIWKTSKDNLNFTNEEKTITNGKVIASYFPSNSIIWNAYVVDAGTLVADIVQPTINGTEIDLGTSQFDGMKLNFSYGYGLIEAAVYATSDRAYFPVNANYTAVAGDRMLVDTSAAPLSIQLPATPFVGAYVKIVDVASNFGVNGLTILRNGSLIAGAANDILVDVPDQSLMLVYAGATFGWVYGI